MSLSLFFTKLSPIWALLEVFSQKTSSLLVASAQTVTLKALEIILWIEYFDDFRDMLWELSYEKMKSFLNYHRN